MCYLKGLKDLVCIIIFARLLILIQMQVAAIRIQNCFSPLILRLQGVHVQEQ